MLFQFYVRTYWLTAPLSRTDWSSAVSPSFSLQACELWRFLIPTAPPSSPIFLFLLLLLFFTDLPPPSTPPLLLRLLLHGNSGNMPESSHENRDLHSKRSKVEVGFTSYRLLFFVNKKNSRSHCDWPITPPPSPPPKKNIKLEHFLNTPKRYFLSLFYWVHFFSTLPRRYFGFQHFWMCPKDIFAFFPTTRPRHTCTTTT